ncbi:hypothetical protein BD289DRAFT_135386 [Coniella lustricola]|uniref:Uncharacterized protein n=1 Tax=Coniella lustricola TaxID=2025994 RepID=A0A2T3AFC3_9PEZI|nr:hypothetical protein BD289DRAFT_135386 [Coniella lustricola]
MEQWDTVHHFENHNIHLLTGGPCKSHPKTAKQKNMVGWQSARAHRENSTTTIISGSGAPWLLAIAQIGQINSTDPRWQKKQHHEHQRRNGLPFPSFCRRGEHGDTLMREGQMVKQRPPNDHPHPFPSQDSAKQATRECRKKKGEDHQVREQGKGDKKDNQNEETVAGTGKSPAAQAGGRLLG